MAERRNRTWGLGAVKPTHQNWLVSSVPWSVIPVGIKGYQRGIEWDSVIVTTNDRQQRVVQSQSPIVEVRQMSAMSCLFSIQTAPDFPWIYGNCPFSPFQYTGVRLNILIDIAFSDLHCISDCVYMACWYMATALFTSDTKQWGWLSDWKKRKLNWTIKNCSKAGYSATALE